MESNTNPSKTGNVWRRYLPVAALILVTLALMIYFKTNKRNISKIIEEGKRNLVSFYSANLKPLLFKTEISNEDVFNFALYQNLPIDKENNKVLVVSNQPSGEDVYELKPAEIKTNTDNYGKFTQFLDLTDREKYIADSILASYKNEIYSSVLMNDNNTIAVSPKLAAIQQAAFADIVAFAQTVNRTKADELFRVQHNFSKDRNVYNMISEVKHSPDNNFIFITPDTIFQSQIQTDMHQLKIEIAEAARQFEKQKQAGIEMPIKIKFDTGKIVEIPPPPPVPQTPGVPSDIYKVVYPDKINARINTMVYDSVRMALDQASEKLRELSIKMPKIRINRGAASGAGTEGKQIPHLEFNLDFVPAVVGEAMNAFTKNKIGDEKYWEEFGRKVDSLANAYNLEELDTAKIRRQKEELRKKWLKKLDLLKKQKLESSGKDFQK